MNLGEKQKNNTLLLLFQYFFFFKRRKTFCSVLMLAVTNKILASLVSENQQSVTVLCKEPLDQLLIYLGCKFIAL